jgi:hypothetical protein
VIIPLNVRHKSNLLADILANEGVRYESQGLDFIRENITQENLKEDCTNIQELDLAPLYWVLLEQAIV